MYAGEVVSDVYREIRCGTYTEGAVRYLYRKNGQRLIQRRLGVGLMRKQAMRDV